MLYARKSEIWGKKHKMFPKKNQNWKKKAVF